MCDCEGPPVTVFQSDTSEEVCVNCGVVVESVLYEGRDWSFDQTSRVGAPGAVTGTSVFGVPGVSKRTMACAIDRHESAARATQASIDATCAALRIATPSVISATAADMYAIHARACRHHGDKTASIAACVYYACRSEKADRELRVVSSACQVDMKALNAAAKAVKDSLRGTPYAAGIAETSLTALLGKCVERLDLPAADRKRLWGECNRVMDSADLDCGKKPRTVVGGVVLAACTRLGIGMSKKEVTVAAGVCAQTIDKAVTV